MFKILINNYDYTKEVADFAENISRQINYNPGNFVWTSTMTSTYTATGSLYTMFLNKMLAGQFCENLEVSIQKLDNELYYTIFQGKIMMSDVKWDISKARAKFSIVNPDWQTKIENNLEVPVPSDARQSKSSNSVTPININGSQQTTLDVMIARNKANTLDYSKYNVVAWNIDSLFRHIVKYISDDEITYYSYFLSQNYLENSSKLFVTSGYNIRNGTSRKIEVSFSQLFHACRKLLNLVMYFEKNKDSVTLRIEDALSISQSSIGITLDDIQNVELNYDQNSYHSAVKVGNTNAFQNNTEIGDNFNYPKVEGATYAIETFAVNRDCNVNNVLDLTISDFTYDHNKIEDILVNDNSEYDEDLFFIQVRGTTPVRSDYLGISQTTNSDRRFFNQALINKKIIERHEVYGKLIKHHGAGTETFMAYAGYGDVYSNFPYVNTTTNPITNYYEVVPTNFPNDSTVVTFGTASTAQPFDNNGNYNNAKPYAFVCPSDGLYRFITFNKWSVTPITGNYYHFYSILTVRNSGNSITQQKVFKYMAHKFVGPQGNAFNDNVEYINNVYVNAPEPYTGLDSLATNGNGNVFQTQNIFNDLTGETITVAYDILSDSDLYLDAGDYVDHSIVIVESDRNRRNNSNHGSWSYPLFPDGYGATIIWKGIYFGCIWTLNGGNIEINTKDGSGKLRRLKFDKFLTDSQLRLLFENSQQKVSTSIDNMNFAGKIMNLTTNDKTNYCKFDLKLD